MTYQINAALNKFQDTRANARRFHKHAIGDVNPAHCFADFLGKVSVRDHEGIRKEYGASLDYAHSNWLDDTGCRSKAAMAESTGGQTGGYLVPLELSLDLMADVAEAAFIRPLAAVVKMHHSTLSLPYPDATSLSGTVGVPSFFGGIQMKFLSEAQTRAETEPKFRSVELHANDLSGIALVSNLMMDDADGLDSWLRRLFAKSIAWFEDYFFLNGSGLGQPTGILNGGGLLKVSRHAPTTVAQVDVATMDGDLLPYSFNHACWLVSVSAIAQLRQITGYIPNASIVSDFNGTPADGLLLNRPVFVTEKLPALGTLGDVLLFDPTLFVIGDRQAVEIDLSTDYPTVWANNQTAWRVLERVDGQPVFSKTVTLQDQATVASPYIALN